MKVSELKKSIEENPWSNGDAEVVIKLAEPSIGPVATSKITGAGFGFDWESGMFLLFSESSLVRLKEKEALWQMAHDFVYSLAQEKTPKGNPTTLAKRAQRILDKAKEFKNV